jgi:hypothetical protein
MLRPKMKPLAMKYLGALVLASVRAMTAVMSSYAQRDDPSCVPEHETRMRRMHRIADGKAW